MLKCSQHNPQSLNGWTQSRIYEDQVRTTPHQTAQLWPKSSTLPCQPASLPSIITPYGQLPDRYCVIIDTIVAPVQLVASNTKHSFPITLCFLRYNTQYWNNGAHWTHSTGRRDCFLFRLCLTLSVLFVLRDMRRGLARQVTGCWRWLRGPTRTL